MRAAFRAACRCVLAGARASCAVPRRLALAAALALVAAAATVAARLAARRQWLSAALRRRDRLGRQGIGPGDALADQLLDLGDRLAVAGADDGVGGAGLAGAAGAADAMHVVVGVMRDVEIEDVADVGNVEAAGGDVGGDQQLGFAVAERVERGGARRLIQVAVQRDGVEAVTDQRAVKLRDLALAVAEDDGVLEVVGGADQAAQRVALVVRLAAGLDQLLR